MTVPYRLIDPRVVRLVSRGRRGLALDRPGTRAFGAEMKARQFQTGTWDECFANLLKEIIYF